MKQKSLKDYQEDRLDRGIYDKRNTLNDLTGKEWLFSTKTVIPKYFPSLELFEELNLPFTAIPIGLACDLLTTFSKPRSSVLNLFVGIGTIVLANQLLKRDNPANRRKLMAIETQSVWSSYFELLAKRLGVEPIDIIYKELDQVIKPLQDNYFDLIICDLPFWELSPSPNESGQLIPKEVARWLEISLNEIIKAVTKLKLNKYLVIGIPGDEYLNINHKYISSKLNYSISGLTSELLQQQGLVLKAERVWFVPNNSKDNLSLRPLLRRFLIFRKESKHYIPKKVKIDLSTDKIVLCTTKVLHKAFPPSYEHKVRSEHGGMKPPELAQLLIELFSSSEKDLIFDPFAGVGGTLLGASAAGRQAIGIDINERWKELYLQVTKKVNYSPQSFHVGDSRKIIPSILKDKQLDIVLTDVPYWSMDKLKKTRGRFSRAGEPSKERLRSSLHQFNDSKIQTIDEWLNLLMQVFKECFPRLKEGGYLIIFIGNMYRTILEYFDGKTHRVGRYHMLSYILGKELQRLGYVFDQEIIWYSPDKSLHVFGYPFSYIPSIVHQSILVLKK